MTQRRSKKNLPKKGRVTQTKRKSRIVGGETWKIKRTYSNHDEAKSAAKNIRKSGRQARVHKRSERGDSDKRKTTTELLTKS